MDTPRTSSDEIDLLHFIAKLYRFLLQNWLIITVSLGICLAVSYFSYRNAPKVYESKMVAYSEFLTESYARQLLANLQRLCNERNAAALATKLNMTEEEAGQLENFSVESPLSERVVVKEDERTTFNIIVEVSNPAVLPNLQKGLVAFVENNEFVKVRVNEKRKAYQNLIARIDREIGLIESSAPDGGSLYQRQDPVRDPKARKTNSVLFDASTMNVFMYREKMENESKLALLKGLEIVDGFVPIASPSKPLLSVYLASGFSTGVIIALVLLGLRSLHALSKKYPA